MKRDDLIFVFLFSLALFLSTAVSGAWLAPVKADPITTRDPVVVVLKDILHELKDIKREMGRHR